MEVIVEVTTVRTVPSKTIKSHLFLVRFDLLVVRPTDNNEAHVPRVQVFKRWDVVKEECTAATGVFPKGIEHGVVDDELWAASEEVSQVDGLVGLSVDKGVLFLDLDDGECASFSRELVLETRGFFFFFKKRKTGLKPFFWGSDL